MSRLHTVINTSPWVSLAICGQTEALSKLYQQVFMPPALRKEILAGGKSQIGVEELKQANWIHVVEIQDQTKVALLHELDRGEAEVIILAQEQGVEEVIIDERIARMQARIGGLEVEGQTVKGTPGTTLMKFAGIIRTEDAEQMMLAIEQDCRRVDKEE